MSIKRGYLDVAKGVSLGRAGTKAQRLGDMSGLIKEKEVRRFVAEAHTPEAIDFAYSRNVPKGHRRRFAQFFTPLEIAKIMADWVAEKAPERILDPALGTGILAREVGKRLPQAKIVGYEIDPAIAEAARKAGELANLNLDLRVENFLDATPAEAFDAIIANPPYLRHHDLPDSSRRIRQIGSACGVRLSGLTNAYALFLLDCCRRLKPGGRLAFIIPTEWSNSNFGKPVKEYLLRNKLLRIIIYACHSNPVFEDALTTASILLVEKNETLPQTVKTVFVPNDSKIPPLEEIVSGQSRKSSISIREIPVDKLIETEKWDNLIRRGDVEIPEGFVPLRHLAATKRGIATGANSFFHIALAKAREYGITEDRLIRCVGKSNDVASLVFSDKDFEALVNKGRPTHLIDFRGKLSSSEMAYIAQGEKDGLHKRYLTRKRTPWYSIERIHIAPIWAAVFGRAHMRFIVNEARVANLTAFHGVYPISDERMFVRALAAALNSSVVQNTMKSEMRVYGGGLKKVEPRDLLNIKVPNLLRCSIETLTALSAMIEGLRQPHFTDAEVKRLDSLVLQAGSEAERSRETTSPAVRPSRINLV